MGKLIDLSLTSFSKEELCLCPHILGGQCTSMHAVVSWCVLFLCQSLPEEKKDIFIGPERRNSPPTLWFKNISSWRLSAGVVR